MRLSTLASQITQAKNTARFTMNEKELKRYNTLKYREQSFKKLGPFMDNLAISLSLLSSVSAIMDAFEYEKRGQNDQAMIKWLQATANGLMAYGFYVGKYAQKGAFDYLSGKLAGHSGKLLSRLGIVLFIPFIGEAAALAGTIVSAALIFYDLIDMLVTYNRSTLFQRFDYHYNKLNKLDDETLKKFYHLNKGQLKEQFMALGDYNRTFWNDLDFDDLALNALIPLRTLGYPLEQIREMLVCQSGQPSTALS